jgi:hypothetical protein
MLNSGAKRLNLLSQTEGSIWVEVDREQCIEGERIWELGERINPLNVELNLICHLLVLLRDLTFMGPCIVSIFQYMSISNRMQRYRIYLYLETALHVSGRNSTHHQ